MLGLFTLWRRWRRWLIVKWSGNGTCLLSVHSREKAFYSPGNKVYLNYDSNCSDSSPWHCKHHQGIPLDECSTHRSAAAREEQKLLAARPEKQKKLTWSQDFAFVTQNKCITDWMRQYKQQWRAIWTIWSWRRKKSETQFLLFFLFTCQHLYSPWQHINCQHCLLSIQHNLSFVMIQSQGSLSMFL